MKNSKLWNIYVEDIKGLANPNHEEYWGQLNNYDKRVVERAPLIDERYKTIEVTAYETEN